MFTLEERALLCTALRDYAQTLRVQNGLRAINPDVYNAVCRLRGAQAVNDLDVALEVEALSYKLQGTAV